MTKAIIISLAVVSLSASAAFAAKTHHAKKPAAAPVAASTPAPAPMFTVSAADKALYAKNKHDSGMK
jgi:hypothetical protein